jgi:excisionase family DNA binding protein
MNSGDVLASSEQAAWISVKEIAELCHLGQVTIRRLIAENVIPHIRVGRKILIPRAAFFRWWESEALTVRIPSRGRINRECKTAPRV